MATATVAGIEAATTGRPRGGHRSYVGAAVLVGLALAGPGAWVGRGQLVHLVVVGGAFLLVAVPCAVVAGILMGVGRRRRGPTKLGRVLLALSIVVALQLVSLAAGTYLRALDVRDAREFCDEAARALEHERKIAGAYPAALRARPGQQLPYLLRGQDIYVSDGRSFVLSFTERNALVPRTHLYSSERNAWSTF